MSVMSKRKPKDGSGSEPVPRPPRVGRHINVWVDPAVGAAIDSHLELVEPRTTLTGVVELALKEYLKARGLWPPPEAGSGV